MSKVTMRTDLTVSADQLWQTLGQFSAIGTWHPAIETMTADGETAGSVRKLDLVGGGTIIEKLERTSAEDRRYSYSILSGPLPVADYEAEIRVHDNGDGTSTVEWSSDFKPKGVPDSEAVRSIQDVYQQGFDNLAKMYGLKR